MSIVYCLSCLLSIVYHVYCLDEGKKVGITITRSLIITNLYLSFIVVVISDVVIVDLVEVLDGVGIHNVTVVLQGSGLGLIDTGCSQTKLYLLAHSTICHSPPL